MTGILDTFTIAANEQRFNELMVDRWTGELLLKTTNPVFWVFKLFNLGPYGTRTLVEFLNNNRKQLMAEAGDYILAQKDLEPAQSLIGYLYAREHKASTIPHLASGGAAYLMANRPELVQNRTLGEIITLYSRGEAIEEEAAPLVEHEAEAVVLDTSAHDEHTLD